MNTPITDLETQGLVILPYPTEVRDAINKMIGLWERFWALPVEVKSMIPCSSNADGVGYELKDGTGNKGDRKENFDIAVSGIPWLMAHIGKIQDPIALEFVQEATALTHLLKPVILEFARQSEAAFSLKGFAQEVEASEATFFIRFIHYFGDRMVGEEIAVPHVDQSGFTLHLFESDPGLQRLTHDYQWVDMPVVSGETAIIPAMQMQLRSEGKVKATCHRVIATAATAARGRSAAVCFIELSRTPKRDKTKTGRMQEWKPGFNYDLPFEEFRKLFTQ